AFLWNIRFGRPRILFWGLGSSVRAPSCPSKILEGPAGGTRAACGRPPVWISPRGRGPHNPRGVRSGRLPVHNARSTGTRSRRSDAPADHSRPASRSLVSTSVQRYVAGPDEPFGGVPESV